MLSLNKCLSVYYVQGTIVSIEDTVMNKMEKISALWSLHSSEETFKMEHFCRGT